MMKNLINPTVTTSSNSDEKMVSWGFAFKKGFFIFLWCIVWGIIGGIIVLVIGGFSLLSLFTGNVNTITTSQVVNAFVGMMAGAIVGSIISTIGMFATIVKITLESVEEKKAT
jgi:hypothetical protein